MILDSLYHLFFNFFVAVRFVEYLVPLFCLILVLKNIDLRFELLEKDDCKKVVCKANIIFIALLLSMTMWTIILENHAFLINTFGSTISLVHLLIFLYVAQYLKSQQNTYMVNQEMKRREDENRELNQFVNKLGSLYDEIRGFRHDFAGIIASLAPVIQERNMNEIELVYKDVLLTTNAHLQKLDYSAFDLKNIDDLAFRNVLAKEMLEAEKQGVPFKCDVSGHIPVVDIPMLNMIRILSILLRNAVEAAQEADKPLVEVAITNKNHVITVMIYNTRSKIPLNKRRIWEKGVSSKGDDRGLGLYNLKKLLGDYPHLSLETKVGQEDFTQIMTIQ
ncbi:GHKL domain-containing protein [Streptococcus intermedius]|uniref:GHKL domain-containing protein n=2 Tax=Streptococcus intermedius TaxID=1338 RepID=UPI0021ADB2DD|nr:GHKL domain-containing protein [Streptococcus intermedius]